MQNYTKFSPDCLNTSPPAYFLMKHLLHGLCGVLHVSLILTFAPFVDFWLSQITNASAERYWSVLLSELFVCLLHLTMATESLQAYFSIVMFVALLVVVVPLFLHRHIVLSWMLDSYKSVSMFQHSCCCECSHTDRFLHIYVVGRSIPMCNASKAPSHD